MPLHIASKDEQRGIPAHQLKNSQIATLINAGVFCHSYEGGVVMRQDNNLAVLSSRIGHGTVFLDAVDVAMQVRVEVIPNGTHLKITDNE